MAAVGKGRTGKTHFVKAIAAALTWWYIAISPSLLMEDGTEKLGANLRRIMEKARKLENAVIFIDAFEELAPSRDDADLQYLFEQVAQVAFEQEIARREGDNQARLVGCNQTGAPFSAPTCVND